MKKFLALALPLTIAASALTACATNSDPYYNIKVVQEDAVYGCKFVGNLTSSSRNYGMFPETAQAERVKNAKQSAYNLGANRIVLAPAIENGNTTLNEGKAYVCSE